MTVNIIMKKVNVIASKVPTDLKRERAILLSATAVLILLFANELLTVIFFAVTTIANNRKGFFQCNIADVVPWHGKNRAVATFTQIRRGWVCSVIKIEPAKSFHSVPKSLGVPMKNVTVSNVRTNVNQ